MLNKWDRLVKRNSFGPSVQLLLKQAYISDLQMYNVL